MTNTVIEVFWYKKSLPLISLLPGEGAEAAGKADEGKIRK